MIAILLIGDEILSAQVKDENLHFVVSRLAGVGYPTGEARIVRDDREAIAAAFRELHKNYEYVFSAGGVGPTHDDITLSSLAYAFNTPVVEHEQMRVFLERRYGVPLSPMVAGMAMVPEGTEIFGESEGHWPVIRWKNIFVLPGLPRAFQDKVSRIAAMLVPRAVPYGADVYVSQDESDFADWLDDIRTSATHVTIGSYPVWGAQDYRARLTVKGPDPTEVRKVIDALVGYFQTRKGLVRVTDIKLVEYGDTNP